MIVVTGCAGFIGSHLCETLLKQGESIVGIDNFDNFYDISIKKKNLSQFINHTNFKFIEGNICDKNTFEGLNADVVVHLAAKAGVRPSIENPESYIETNINGTQQVLEFMRKSGCKKMVFASSSSVYGNNKETPFSENHNVDNPISPYAFTKKAGELMNHTYHHLYNLDILNLRFFTVYGERQRPDLAIHKFVKTILNNKPITMFGDGSTARDYTYVADTVAGIIGAVAYVRQNNNVFDIINLGNNQPITLKSLITNIYEALGAEPNIIQESMQAGDVDITFANIEKAKQLLGYQPTTSLTEGLKKFISWHKRDYEV